MLTLEERERIAYITHSPDHALLVEAIEGDEAAQLELREEVEELKGERDSAQSEANRLEEDLEAAETNAHTLSGRVEDLEIEVGDLKEQIHAAGVDLV